jgi:acetyl-CoA acetyltransferase
MTKLSAQVGTKPNVNLSGRAYIAGVGASSFERRPDVTVLSLAGTALAQALADAGLEAGQIDGLIVHIGSPRGADYDTIAQIFGLNLRFCSQTWAHGRFAGTVIAHAAMAVASGLATRVACLLAMKNSGIGRIGEAPNPFFCEQFREGGGPHAEEGHIGMASPIAGAAIAFSLYCRRYRQDREKLAAIPLTFRQHAMLTEDAVMRKPLTGEAYRTARPVIEPLRLFDCSIVGDGAVCVIVSGRTQASEAKQPVWLAGAQGLKAGRETFVFAPIGLGMSQQSERRLSLKEARAQPVYAMAGTTPEDIGVLGIYDSFSPLPLYAYEDFGFCEAGYALDFIQNGRIALGGDHPTNTNGGQLSHAQVNGWGQLRELVLQLRGEAGMRQIANARRAMWMTAAGDALILERG